MVSDFNVIVIAGLEWDKLEMLVLSIWGIYADENQLTEKGVAHLLKK